ncbi:MAG: NAD(+)/NADH kinase [Candidatus Melainabacteria bacterium]|nr:NAD(+)/NADH kinase [Candidatus Melainabacteria bacterium]
MKTIGLVYNAEKSETFELVKKIDKHLQVNNIKTITCKVGIESSEWDKLNNKLDLVIILGGDGTLLNTGRALSSRDIPIFGINMGHLGFLTEGKNADAIELTDYLLNNKYTIDERAMLEVTIANSKSHSNYMCALNDVVISRGTSRKMTHLKLNVDNNPVADYVADGLIICTPTGSTAYALSAGGAIMEPSIEGIQIVPICAHSLTSRPHIVSDKREITITFNKPHEGTILQLDGQETITLESEAKVKIVRAKHNAKLIRLKCEENNFYWRIRHKFHFGQTVS